jgi:hypothetical protein
MTAWASRYRNWQVCTAAQTEYIAFEVAGMTIRADERTAIGAWASRWIEARLAIRTIDPIISCENRAHARLRRFNRGPFGGQGVVAVGTIDRCAVDRGVAIRTFPCEQPIARGTDRC